MRHADSDGGAGQALGSRDDRAAERHRQRRRGPLRTVAGRAAARRSGAARGRDLDDPRRRGGQPRLRRHAGARGGAADADPDRTLRYRLDRRLWRARRSRHAARGAEADAARAPGGAGRNAGREAGAGRSGDGRLPARARPARHEGRAGGRARRRRGVRRVCRAAGQPALHRRARRGALFGRRAPRRAGAAGDRRPAWAGSRRRHQPRRHGR